MNRKRIPRLKTIYRIKLADGTNKGLPIHSDVDWATAPPKGDVYG